MARTKLLSLAACAVLAVLSACQREDVKEPLKVSGKVFIFNYRVAQATYVITLARNGPLPDESFAVTKFENPAGGAPIETRTKIFPFWEKVALESPPVHCIVKGKPYAISIRVVDKEGKRLQAIDTTLTSTLDQTIMPSKPLVVGPIYTPNPEVFKADGTRDYAQGADCPSPPSDQAAVN
ncbi:hypothetical protein [Rhizobium glycinendophyticum]|uniref:DUF3304 domain-containing protein n=1 Tax=Rhizobium glycinendophyticum TaxID=2589807 RepID=A0A504UN33_9HYPH|nr:hypothetical protein [Rhizobium glycinendophyticum]TPP12075.1 hypothetical protein FJQ55_07105 [Rhizobium glycinendophyticum]